MAVVLGVDKYRTPTDLWREKLGMAPTDDPTPAMRIGTALEPYAADLYAEHSGRYLMAVPEQLTHAGCPWWVGHIDREIVGVSQPTAAKLREKGLRLSPDHEGEGVLEVKTVGPYIFNRIQREGIPEHWIVQGHHYLGLTGYHWLAFAVLSRDSGRLEVLELDRDEALLAVMRDAGERFWQAVQDRIPPEELAEPIVQLDKKGGRVVQVAEADTLRWAEAMDLWVDAREAVKLADDQKSDARARLLAVMGDEPAAEGPAGKVYYRAQAGRSIQDIDGLANAIAGDRADLVELFENIKRKTIGDAAPYLDAYLDKHPIRNPGRFTRQGKTSRPFRVYPSDGPDE